MIASYHHFQYNYWQYSLTFDILNPNLFTPTKHVYTKGWRIFYSLTTKATTHPLAIARNMIKWYMIYASSGITEIISKMFAQKLRIIMLNEKIKTTNLF